MSLEKLNKTETEIANKLLDEELAHINTELDGRFLSVRAMETNLGNFLCDIMLNSITADCAVINGGSLRSDTLHSSGTFTRRHLRQILPFDCELTVLAVTGLFTFLLSLVLLKMCIHI